MQNKINGWIVVNYYHPNGGGQMVCSDTFATTRTVSIKTFIQSTGTSWIKWKSKYNFQCVKASQEIIVKHSNK